jgi:hypothetical protein
MGLLVGRTPLLLLPTLPTTWAGYATLGTLGTLCYTGLRLGENHTSLDDTSPIQVNSSKLPPTGLYIRIQPPAMD